MNPKPELMKWLALAAIAAAGCADDPARATAADPGGTVATVAALSPGQPCPTRDAVAFQPLGAATDRCTRVPGWTENELVRHGAGPGGSLVPGIFCWYRASGDGPPDFDALASVARGAEPDCPLLTPQAAALLTPPSAIRPLPASGLPNLTRMPADLLSAEMADAVPGLPAGPGDVHVAVLDTSGNPYDSTTGDSYLHGRAVARTIARLACSDPEMKSSRDCAQHIESRLAMSYVNQPSDPDGRVDTLQGGYYGTRAELALQIRQVLDDLQAAPPDRRQIINLSLAWEPEADGMYPDAARVALQHLLERAACQGVLTVAAAGNGRRSGAMLPAAWERVAAPDAAACLALGFKPRAPFAAGKTGYRPLIHAVGATDAPDRPLATSRAGSLPRLVAYGMDVDSGLRLPGSETPPTYTGTSMATAIASGAAAAVWAWLPALDPHDVMAMVYDSAVDLPGRLGPPMDGRGTEVCLGSIGCAQLPIHRVSVCGAVAAAITVAAAGTAGTLGPKLPAPACATVPAHSAIDAPPVAIAAPGARFGFGGLPAPGATASSRSCSAAACKPQLVPSLPALEPWTRPQPERPPCPTCRLTQPNIYGNSYLWGSTRSTLVTNSLSLQLVVTPYLYGIAQPEQAILLTNQPGDLPLNDWIATYSVTSAAARFEWLNGITKVVVVASQSTAINVDTP